MSGPFVGIDVGTSGVKALAIDGEGSVLSRVELGYPLSAPRPGWSEQDPADWWEATESMKRHCSTERLTAPTWSSV